MEVYVIDLLGGFERCRNNKNTFQHKNTQYVSDVDFVTKAQGPCNIWATVTASYVEMLFSAFHTEGLSVRSQCTLPGR